MNGLCMLLLAFEILNVHSDIVYILHKKIKKTSPNKVTMIQFESIPRYMYDLNKKLFTTDCSTL